MEELFRTASSLTGGATFAAAEFAPDDTYTDAAVIGGFALATLAASEVMPTPQQIVSFGAKTMASLPPTVRDTIYKMFMPATANDRSKIYAALALLYLLDSLKAITIAPEIETVTKQMARQRWVIMQRYLQSLPDEIRHIYTRLLRLIHLPHHCPRSCCMMKRRWLAAINNRSRPWGRSTSLRALPHQPSTKSYAADATWNGPYKGRPMRDRAVKKRPATTVKAGPARKKRPYYDVWSEEVVDVLPPYGAAAAEAAVVAKPETK